MTSNDSGPILSRNIDDISTPGVVIEVDPDIAEALGAFRDPALDDEAAP